MSSDRPLTGAALRKAVIDHITTGRVTFSAHALARLRERKVTALEATRVLRSGALTYEATERGRHRYLASSTRIAIVFTFEHGLIVITVIVKG
jgi:hypothetical protein